MTRVRKHWPGMTEGEEALAGNDGG
jgi:hypothetical protein